MNLLERNGFLLLCGVVASTACSSGSSTDRNDNSSIDQTNIQGNLTSSIASNAPDGLNGIWALSCKGAMDEKFIIYEKKIENDLHFTSVLIFLDSGCQIPANQHKIVGTESVVYSGTTETALGTAYNIDRTIEAVTYDGIVQDIEPETVYDIFLVIGDDLYTGSMGAVRNGESAESRPVEIEKSRPKSRQ